MITVDEGKIAAVEDFQRCLILYLILKYENIIKTNLNLMVFTREILYLQ